MTTTARDLVKTLRRWWRDWFPETCPACGFLGVEAISIDCDHNACRALRVRTIRQMEEAGR